MDKINFVASDFFSDDTYFSIYYLFQDLLKDFKINDELN